MLGFSGSLRLEPPRAKGEARRKEAGFRELKLRWMIYILHYLKDPKLWELWYIPCYEPKLWESWQSPETEELNPKPTTTSLTPVRLACSAHSDIWESPLAWATGLSLEGLGFS